MDQNWHTICDATIDSGIIIGFCFNFIIKTEGIIVVKVISESEENLDDKQKND
jgi:hypothetical protein